MSRVPSSTPNGIDEESGGSMADVRHQIKPIDPFCIASNDIQHLDVYHVALRCTDWRTVEEEDVICIICWVRATSKTAVCVFYRRTEIAEIFEIAGLQNRGGTALRASRTGEDRSAAPCSCGCGYLLGSATSPTPSPLSARISRLLRISISVRRISPSAHLPSLPPRWLARIALRPPNAWASLGESQP